MGHHSRWLHYTSDELSGFERIKVDVAQTSFFEGREFRTFKELNIAVGATLVIKVNSPVNTVVFGFGFDLDAGWMRCALKTGGTEGGTFNGPLPILAVNSMSAGSDHRDDFGPNQDQVYSPVITMSSGGTHTGGVEHNVIRAKVGGNSQSASSTGVAPTDETGMPAATYYICITNLGNEAVTGVFRARWEERP